MTRCRLGIPPSLKPPSMSCANAFRWCVDEEGRGVMIILLTTVGCGALPSPGFSLRAGWLRRGRDGRGRVSGEQLATSNFNGRPTAGSPPLPRPRRVDRFAESSRSGVARMHAHCQAAARRFRDPPGTAPGCNFRLRWILRLRDQFVRPHRRCFHLCRHAQTFLPLWFQAATYAARRTAATRPQPSTILPLMPGPNSSRPSLTSAGASVPPPSDAISAHSALSRLALWTR